MSIVLGAFITIVTGIIVIMVKFYFTKKLKDHESKLREIEKSKDAATAIREKYLIVFNAYPNCVFMPLNDDTKEKLKERLSEFKPMLTDFRTTLQLNEVHILDKGRLANVKEIVHLIDHYVSKELTLSGRQNSRGDRNIYRSELDIDDALRDDITKTQERILQLERLVIKDFDFLITGKLKPPETISGG